MNLRKSTVHSLRPGLVVAIALLIGACGKSPPPAPTPIDKPAQPVANPAVPRPGEAAAPTTPTPAVAADESEPPDRPRPRVLLWVEGSPDEDTIWRGWPVLVRVQTLAGDLPADVQMRGPSSVALTRAGAVWLIPPTESAKLALGSYTLSAGDRQIEIAVADAARELTTGQHSIRSRLLVQSAVASGDTTAAKQAADAWAQTAPASFEAREAQGDARRVLGDSSGALDAYNEALSRVPRGIDPPPANVHAKITELLKERAAALAKNPAAAPTADEAKYYALIDAGDKAVATGDHASASLRYAEADVFRRDRQLAISSIELDDKRAALGVATAVTSPAAPARLPASPKPTLAEASANGVVVSAAELDEAKILADANGQWAASAAAGSQYGSPNYSAAKMVGAPDVPIAGDSVNAWCHGSSSKPDEWIELTYAKPARATEVRVRQNNCPGAITRIEAIEPDGTAHVWWAGSDPFKAPSQATLAWFAVCVPRTDYLVAKIKITLNLAAVSGWKEIDAVQLVGPAAEG